MKSPKISITNNINSSPRNSTTFYEPTSVLDPHLTSSPAAVAGPAVPFHAVDMPPPSGVTEWDPLVPFFAENMINYSNAAINDNEYLECNFIDHLIVDDLPDVELYIDPMVAPPPFGRTHLDLLLKAAASVESNDVTTAHVILSRLNQILKSNDVPTAAAGTNSSTSTALQRAAVHFKDALLSLLPISNPPTASPADSPLEIINRITAHKAFSDLSPIPQFTGFTANQAILESLLDPSQHNSHPHRQLHVIDFDLGLGSQWSSFVQEIASRSRSLRTPPPRIRITAVVPDETVETVLAAENLRDFARAVGVHLTVVLVHVGILGTLALGSVPVSSGEAVGVVLTPTIFKLIGNTPDSSAALLRFVKQVSPRIVVFVDSECQLEAHCCGSFRRSFASGLEFYSSLIESVDAVAAAADNNSLDGKEAAGVVRRIDEAVLRPRIFGAVAGWVPRETSWREALAGSGMAAAGFSEFTESQAEWLLKRTAVEGFHVARREGALVLSWRGRDLAATSAWRC